MDLPVKFRTLRTQKDISVYKLSKDTDISQNYIRKIEKGESQPAVLVLEKLLARALRLLSFSMTVKMCCIPQPMNESLWKQSGY